VVFQSLANNCSSYVAERCHPSSSPAGGGTLLFASASAERHAAVSLVVKADHPAPLIHVLACRSLLSVNFAAEALNPKMEFRLSDETDRGSRYAGKLFPRKRGRHKRFHSKRAHEIHHVETKNCDRN
jgi:hypothetical protein